MNKQEAAALGEMVDSLAARHPGVPHTIEVVHGNPARVLHEVSKGCDLLILARRRHALPRGHIGGTARAMLHHSACPLMFLPAPDEAVHLSTEPG
jgi:nucleotide-binding universal stress UspA family protein